MDDLIGVAVNAANARRFSPCIAVTARINGLEGLRPNPQVTVATVEVVLDEVAKPPLQRLHRRRVQQDMARVAISAEGRPDLAQDDPYHPLNTIGLLIEGAGVEGTSMTRT